VEAIIHKVEAIILKVEAIFSQVAIAHNSHKAVETKGDLILSQ